MFITSKCCFSRYILYIYIYIYENKILPEGLSTLRKKLIVCHNDRETPTTSLRLMRTMFR